MRTYVVIAVCALAVLLGARAQAGDGGAAPGTVEVSADVRAATLRFAPSVKPADRAWIMAAIASARPEAQRLIAEIDGSVEIRTDLPPGEAIGLASMSEAGSV